MNFKKIILFALLSCGAIAFHKPAKAVSPANNVAIYFAAGLDHSPNSMNNLESQKEYVDELKSMGVTPRSVSSTMASTLRLPLRLEPPAASSVLSMGSGPPRGKFHQCPSLG